MLRKMRDTPQGLQPGLVTPGGTVVLPGASLTEPLAERDHLGPFSALSASYNWEAPPKRDHSLTHLPTPPPKWYSGHNSLPSAPVNPKFPLPSSQP